MPYIASHGKVYRSDISGTYRCNDNDPQNADEDAPDAEDIEGARADYLLDQAEARELYGGQD